MLGEAQNGDPDLQRIGLVDREPPLGHQNLVVLRGTWALGGSHCPGLGGFGGSKASGSPVEALALGQRMAAMVEA
ncbi:hypothetical protein RirG_031500 [Rhizophagus irregularis DAOM 197198w]|uniref:Uncharacterized protein n=1 Tax=Rhizophagus irregularis (strain DAOM 197198w) TaxID=1432141 RepID=A0A015K4C8_RHIIW|nr:hypothetical protein RirG_031500 [Rhizophagus irregularis DAOM 197198w]